MRIPVLMACAVAAVLLSCPQAAWVNESPCALPVILPEAAANARLTFLGEYHGTQETPLFAAEYACTLAQKGQRVTLALEMLQTEQKALDAYLASDGGEAARRMLISTPFWRGTRDGRSSTGMVAMIERVRVLRSQGLKVDLLPLDGVTEGTRDETMAVHLRRAMHADGQRRFVVLAGNMHTRRAARGDGFDPGYDSLAYLLRDNPSITLNVLPRSGSAWVCLQRNSCGPNKIQGPIGAEHQPAQIRLGGNQMPGYDGTVSLPMATAAPPAVGGIRGP